MTVELDFELLETSQVDYLSTLLRNYPYSEALPQIKEIQNHLAHTRLIIEADLCLADFLIAYLHARIVELQLPHQQQETAKEVSTNNLDNFRS